MVELAPAIVVGGGVVGVVGGVVGVVGAVGVVDVVRSGGDVLVCLLFPPLQSANQNGVQANKK